MKNYYLLAFIFLPVLLCFSILFKKDRYEDNHKFWENQKWSCLDALIILIIISFLQLCSLALIKLRVVSNYSIMIYGNFSFSIIIGLIQYKILSLKYNFNLSSIISPSAGVFPSNIYKGLKIFAIYIGIIFFIGIILNQKYLIINRAKDIIELGLFKLQITTIIVFVLGLVVVAPFVEEFIYRGLMYRPFQKKLGETGSICATSFLWSLNHLQIQSFFSLFLIGIILGYLYKSAHSLIPGVVFHAMINISSLTIYAYIIMSGHRI